MAITLNTFLDLTVQYSKISYVFEPFFSLFDGHDFQKFSDLNAEIAVNSGAYPSKQEYFEDIYFFDEDEKENAADLISSEFRDFIPNELTYLQKRILDIFTNKFISPKTFAKALSYQSIFDVELKVISDHLSALQHKYKNNHWSDLLLSLEFLSKYSKPAIKNILELISAEKSWFLVPCQYRLFIPSWQGDLLIADPIDTIIHESSQNPAIIYKLSGRDFEKFLRRIFEGFGYEVQLTAASRDGGIDLICVQRTVMDIPVKIAIEAKRYSPNRPVVVSLVRQFVGANKQFKANKLVYVTTSRYTREAKKYATAPELADLLELKELPDILRWVADFMDRQYIVGI